MASKSADVRPKITLACSGVQGAQLHTKKNRRNTPTVSASPSSAPAAASTLSTARPAENRVAIPVATALPPRSKPRRHHVGGASPSPRGRCLASER